MQSICVYFYIDTVIMSVIILIYNQNECEVRKMRINRRKYELARARACMGQKDLEKSGIPKGTLCRALRSEVLPETAGRIARALGVDVTEIIED